ncbi:MULTISPECIES: PTS transporter subunit IIC [Leuconostoc]|uniref:PTS sugar transporter subunit IIC n=1 Tax=Leuconostoc pseudomesenteroides TaxID=33968 RepID=A0A5B8T4G7_LEUPS|nr:MULTISPECIES: PTS sugar transporter subunit IIC [Leuconostoc]MCC8440361.1 PTS sugar transporter subunit IIC [Leuconostoc pseudomesenteroides]MCT4386741.1 PTS sugar transporter subunit IIC [Leuconostoc pseudomesenteroides]MDG9733310.1 PTS sugar transporter subunit IIC [Leuconostoc pseudomesenteroides]MDN2451687.1 PTS sugar transporter subunit IIC [Leuconostoc sp. UCMA20149]NKZ36541.1 PTS sugar transporter subunit IIC [Leuconostoc pseudomesenteroides]
MAQNAITAEQVKSASNKKSAAVDKESIRDTVYKVSAAVSNAILVTLGMGLLLQTIAGFIHWAPMVQMGAITKVMLPAAFGAAIASQMKTNTMVMFSAMAASAVGANAVFFTDKAVQGVTATGYAGAQAAGSAIITTGQPISAVLAGLIAVLFGKWLSGKTPLDMVIVPAATTIVGTVAGYYLAAVTTPILVAIGAFIASSVAVNPIIGTAVVAMVFGALTMTPASAAALAVAIGATGVTSPEAAGAILIGTTAVFVGFPAMSFHENKIGATIAQGIVTPKIQFPNLTENPALIIPPMIGAAIAAPIATMVFHVTAPFAMAGIGFNSFIVPLALAGSNPVAFAAYMGVGVAVPIVVSFIGYRIMRKIGWAKPQQLHLEMI